MADLKHLLEGRPFKSPLHTGVVHFPLACFAIGTLLDCASWVLQRPELHLVDSAFWAVVAGVISALVAAVLGFVDYTSIRDDHPGKKWATAHMALNLVSVALYTVSIGARYQQLDDSRTPLLAFALSLIGFLILTASGWIGGHLVYNDGVGVGRHRRRTDLPDETRVPEEEVDGFAPVCHVDEFVEGSSLRANLRGTVVAIARSGGEFFAVQEFCTHRFGPLSEGAIEDGRIICPWHRTCFDLRTGAVTEGPAKVPLRTFPVEIRNGRIFVKVPGTPQPSAR